MTLTPCVWTIVIITVVSILSSSRAATTVLSPSSMTTKSKDVPSAFSKQDGGGVQTSSSKPNMAPDQATKSAQDDVVTKKFIIHDEVLPSITFPAIPLTNIIMDSNRYEVMHCKAEGKPAPRYEWFRDGIKIRSEDHWTRAFVNGTLVLESFSDIENGYFQCKASNSLGTSVSDIVHIIAQVMPTKAGVDVNKIMSIPEKEPYSILCDDIRPTVPLMHKRWYDSEDKNELTIDARRGVDSDGTLHFAYTKLGEDDNIYWCGLVPARGTISRITLFKRGELFVKSNAASSLESTKPKKMFSKEDIKATIGESVTLECFFASLPPAKIIWKNSSNHKVQLGDSRLQVIDFGRKLVIAKVKQQDEGTFSCTGENRFGSTEIFINVNVTSRPMVIPGGALISETVVDNRDITLNCKTTAAIEENLEPPRWYRNGQLLTQNNLPDPGRYKFNNDLTELQIKDLDKQTDTACFQCNVSNSEGYEFFDASIRVINSIKITKQPADEIVIKHGDSVDITIQATGDACCQIDMLWSFNGSNIIHPEQWKPFQRDPLSGKLFFNSSLISEESLYSYVGVYTCHVSNKHQSIDKKFAILLEGSRTEPVAAKSSSIGMWWIGLVCGILAILIAVVIVIVLYKSNYPRSTYKLEQQEIKHHLNPEEDLLNQSFHEI